MIGTLKISQVTGNWLHWPVKVEVPMLKMVGLAGVFLSANGSVPQNLKDYYEAIARGGVALVTVAGGIVRIFCLAQCLPGTASMTISTFPA